MNGNGQHQHPPVHVVIERRGAEDTVWSTEDGLVGYALAPFGVVGEFEGGGGGLLRQFISWYDITSLSVMDAEQEIPETPKAIALCDDCHGGGIIHSGENEWPCETCSGFGHVPV